uniref:Uncharacterized protein n=1 Tax=viral metagenome TaxID=1070528 RepID=A0A6M3LZ87_9ZZZZ
MRLRGYALKIFDDAAIWAVRRGSRIRLVSANDHLHSLRSAHYEDRAVDLWGDDLEGLAAWLRSLGYLVYWQVPGHYRHVHAEAKP